MNKDINKMSLKEYRAYIGKTDQPEKKKNKYNAKKTEVSGIVFDSKKEAFKLYGKIDPYSLYSQSQFLKDLNKSWLS